MFEKKTVIFRWLTITLLVVMFAAWGGLISPLSGRPIPGSVQAQGIVEAVGLLLFKFGGVLVVLAGAVSYLLVQNKRNTGSFTKDLSDGKKTIMIWLCMLAMVAALLIELYVAAKYRWDDSWLGASGLLALQVGTAAMSLLGVMRLYRKFWPKASPFVQMRVVSAGIYSLPRRRPDDPL
jgi:hypothetical protein